MEAENDAPNKTTKKQRIIKTLIFLLVLLFIAALIPQKLRYKDGGSVEYKALLYSVTKWHAIGDPPEAAGEPMFILGTTVEILGIKVYENKYASAEAEPKS